MLESAAMVVCMSIGGEQTGRLRTVLHGQVEGAGLGSGKREPVLVGRSWGLLSQGGVWLVGGLPLRFRY